MTVLLAGNFKVSDYRKAIPSWVKIVCAIRALDNLDYLKRPCAVYLVEWVRSLRFDHRPPLQDRDFDLIKRDFIPPQNDPDHIEAIPAKVHDQRTFGRAPDAEKVVTTRGSDIGEAARTKNIRANNLRHLATLAAKQGSNQLAADLIKDASRLRRQKPKRKIPSRPFPTRRKRDEKRLSRRNRQ